ncbi:MAG: regulatory iron-sulfur-containing complex subunit RicT [Bacteroidota bacterium]
MGCTSCSSGGGTPKGCQNNGTCSSGGCNKLGVFDWLGNMKLPSGQAPYDIVEVRFKNSRKEFYRNDKNLSLQVGDVIVVDVSPGYDVGVVSIVGELARIQVNKKSPNLKPLETKKILRIANQADIDKWAKARELEKEVMFQSRTLALNLKLQMKISDVEYQGDLSKAAFYYTADQRVDFRQLIKDMADKFKVRVEMRQIGSRQEASRLGGIGSCGRELCCSTWLTDFRTVSTSAARYQQLSLNPQKLAGQCGKLKCCLNYELDMYLDAIKSFPTVETKLQTEKGTAFHVKTDVFKRLMWYMYSEGSGLIALSPERVAEIKKMNEQKQKPADLVSFVEKKVIVEPVYANVDAQDSLNRFDNTFKNKKKKKPAGTSTGSVSANSSRPNSTNSNQNRPNPQNLTAGKNLVPNPNQAPKASTGPASDNVNPNATGDAENKPKKFKKKRPFKKKNPSDNEQKPLP